MWPRNGRVHSGCNDKSGNHEVTDVIEDSLQTGSLKCNLPEGIPHASQVFHEVLKLIHSSKFGLDRIVGFGRQEALLRVRVTPDW